MRYIYESPIGTFWIQPDKKMWALGLDGECLGHYKIPEQAVDDVAMHVTGWYAWDGRDRSENEPKELSEWERQDDPRH